MTTSEMAAVILAQGKTEKPTKGFGEWTTNRTLMEALVAVGFAAQVSPNSTPERPVWRLNVNGNRFRAIRKALSAAGAPNARG